MTTWASAQDAVASFISANLPVAVVPSVPEVRLYTARPTSGLGRLAGAAGSPYWAYPWAGGLALARHVLDRPGTVRGRTVLDLGAGSGLVAIAAAKAGAAAVSAAEIDRNARVALELNAALNGVALKIEDDDPTLGPAPRVDLVLVGDLFYERALAERVTRYLSLCVAAGIEVLVGDPGRAFLPRDRLRRIADYFVPDVGDGIGAPKTTSTVFAFGAVSAAPVSPGSSAACDGAC